jgi:hypothetical protein
MLTLKIVSTLDAHAMDPIFLFRADFGDQRRCPRPHVALRFEHRAPRGAALAQKER